MSEYNYNNEPSVYKEPVVSKGAKTMGIISMIIGIVSITNGFSWGAGIAMAIAGLVLSSKARSRGEYRFSKAGRITSIIGLIGGVLGLIILIIFTFTGLMASFMEGFFEGGSFILSLFF